MIKKPLLCLLCFCAFITVQAQDSLHVKPQASASYKAAVGLRYSVGGPGHTDIGITAKYFIKEHSALEAYANLPLNFPAFLASLSYIWQPKLIRSDRFSPYVGIGGGVLWHTESQYGPEGKAYISPVAFGTLGIEYRFKRLPMVLSLDYRSLLISTDQRAPMSNHISRANSLGLGLKYTIR